MNKTHTKPTPDHERQVAELLLQSLERQKCAILVFETARKCAVDREFLDELAEGLKTARHGVEVLTEGLFSLGMDPDRCTPGRKVARELSEALVEAMDKASSKGPSQAAQLVASECITLAENQKCLDWALIGKCAENAEGDSAPRLQAMCAAVTAEEACRLHYFHGWCRQLWMEALGVHGTPAMVRQEKSRPAVPVPAAATGMDLFAQTGIAPISWAAVFGHKADGVAGNEAKRI